MAGCKGASADDQISDWDTGRRIASGTHTKTWKAVAKL